MTPGGTTPARSLAVTGLVAVIVALAIAEVAGASTDRAPEAPTALTVGDRSRPLAVEGAPSFGWLPEDRDGNELQTAYRLRITREGEPGLVWDSGRVASSSQSSVAYGGPALAPATSYRWTVRTWDREGRPSPWAAAARFDTALSADGWDAEWIRRNTRDQDGEFEPDDYTLARREAEISASPIVRARAYVAAVHQYELYLNGERVDRGLSSGYPGELYYQATDVTDAVSAGEPLAVGALYHWFGSGQGRPAVEPGLLVRIVVEHADGSREEVVSDDSWRMAPGPWLESPRRNGEGDYVERIDARLWPQGWDEPGFDDSDWEQPEVVGRVDTEEFGAPSGLEPRLRETEIRPLTVSTLGDGSVVADFGRVVPAQPVVDFAHGDAGREVELRAGYLLEPDGSVSTERGTQSTDMSYGYVQRDGAQEFKPLDYLGFRYLQISDPGEPLTRGEISAIVQHTDPDPARAAQFSSSNRTLDEVFELMQRSALYSGIQHFVDTPTREKGQFLNDAINISHATMSGLGERDLTQKAIREFVASQQRFWPDGRLNAVYPNGDGARDIPDFTELFPTWVERYWMQTGDRELTEQAYPAMLAITDYIWSYRSPVTGLITQLAGGSGDYEFGIVDWPAQGRFGYDMETAARTTVNALGVEALRRTAEVGRALGRPASEVAGLESRAALLGEAINERLRLADGTYVDGLEVGGRQSEGTSQHAGAYALAFGIVPPDERESVARGVAAQGMRMGRMTAHWLLAGLAAAGRADQVLERLTDRGDYGWAQILARGGTFTWESWDAREEGQSESHGWGAMALIDIQETLLGARVSAPGASQVTISPPSDSGLRRAEGAISTERGQVGVRWRERRNGLAVTVDVPVNVRAEVRLALDPPRRYRAHGEGEPRLEGVSDGEAVYRVGSGRSRFVPVGR